jgi:uncharacterized RDD family membrane protein YckC
MTNSQPPPDEPPDEIPNPLLMMGLVVAIVSILVWLVWKVLTTPLPTLEGI